MAEETNLQKVRQEKVKRLRDAGINPYAYSFDKTHTVGQVMQSEGKVVKTAGKILSFREHGNIAFADLGDETGTIQIFFQKEKLGDAFEQVKYLDAGDFIGVEGEVGRTTAGELSILPTSLTLLTKAILPLPNQWYGLKDVETRFRQRYLDLLINPEIRERFNIRTKVVSGVREYLDNLGFWEVETPVLQPMYGGANAKPFTTHFNALDQKMYLRIAVELYIKRLIAGGYEKVYEIAKDFRNEGLDQTHSPEFTMLEWYEAYVDYNTMMDRAEGLLKFLANKLFGTTVLQVDDKKIDIGNKWPRIPMSDILKEKLELDVEKESRESLIAYMKEKCPDAKIIGTETKGQLIFLIFDHLIPKMLKEPTWIVDYPADISPFARPHREKEGWVERYEGYIGGKEVFDGWTEITDPTVQRQAWIQDSNAARTDKEEAQQVDEDYLTAMEYGMPPYGGIGIGIDRLVMLYTNTWAIKELILFPTLKKEKVEKEANEKEQKEISSSVPTEKREVTQANVKDITMTRDEAFNLLKKYMESPNLIKHSLAAEAAMKGIYRYLYKDNANEHDEAIWGITGLLHDIDYEVAQKENLLEAHGKLLFERDPEILKGPIQHAIRAHNYTKTGTDPETDMDWAISCVDQLTGLVVSSTLISPDRKLASVDTPFVMKRFNSPSFSKGVDRENIKLCESTLAIPLEEFVGITIASMQRIASELGL